MVAAVEQKRLRWNLPQIQLSCLEQFGIETAANVTAPNVLSDVVVHPWPVILRFDSKRCLINSEMSVKIMVLRQNQPSIHSRNYDYCLLLSQTQDPLDHNEFASNRLTLRIFLLRLLYELTNSSTKLIFLLLDLELLCHSDATEK